MAVLRKSADRDAETTEHKRIARRPMIIMICFAGEMPASDMRLAKKNLINVSSSRRYSACVYIFKRRMGVFVL